MVPQPEQEARKAIDRLLEQAGSQDFEPIVVSDSLAADPGDRFDLVLTNPPFGKKSSTTIVGEVAPAIHGSRDISSSGRFLLIWHQPNEPRGQST